MTCTSSSARMLVLGQATDGRLHRADLREHEDQRKNADAEAGGVVAPIDEQKENGDQERADRRGFEEIVDRQVTDGNRDLDDGYEMQRRRDEKCEQRGFEEASAPAQ